MSFPASSHRPAWNAVSGLFTVVAFCMPLASCKKSAHDPSRSSTTLGRDAFETCDVVVAGGTTAALAAALSAAQHFKESGADRTVCLLEPTDWVGGQFTASGVSAVDFAHHAVKIPDKPDRRFDTGRMGRMVVNSPRLLREWFTQAPFAPPDDKGEFGWNGNPAGCWVSVRCYLPESLLPTMESALKKYPRHLKVFRNTVVKSASVDAAGAITSLTAITRTFLPTDTKAFPKGEWSTPLSTRVEDWYSPNPSDMFSKTIRTFGLKGSRPAVIDATEWGDVLVTSGAAYTQGIEREFDENPENREETCGQAIVFPMALELRDAVVNPGDPGFPKAIDDMKSPYPEHYSLNKRSFETVWTYRRIKKGTVEVSFDGTDKRMYTNDISMQNWVDGNDYPYRYLFTSIENARKQAGLNAKGQPSGTAEWRGGLDPKALSEAEAHAHGWFKWLRAQDHKLAQNLALSDVMGTTNGLSKVPYIRDTRRSIGAGGFMLKYHGPDGIFVSKDWGEDTIALGIYEADIHPTVCADSPAHLPAPGSDAARPKPFTIPMRALTNQTRPNLLVAGKTMAQTFVANAALRLHPIEFSTGVAAGVTAALSIVGSQSSKAQATPDFPAFASDASAVKNLRAVLTAPQGADGQPLHAPLVWQGADSAERDKRPWE